MMRIKPKRPRSTLAANIINRRKTLKWSQSKLAEKADIGTNTIKDIERGLSSGSPQTLKSIAQALSCAVDDLYQLPAKEPVAEVDFSHGVVKILEILEKRIPEQEQIILDQADLIGRLSKRISELEIINEQYLLRLSSFEAGRTPELVNEARRILIESKAKVQKMEAGDAPTSKSKPTKRK